MTRPIAAIDTETDGLHWSRQAWEIAIVRRDPGGEELTKVMLLDIDLRRADPKALEIGGFYERHPRGIYLSTGRKHDYHAELTSPEQAAYWVHRLTFGATIIGAQPHFDTHIFERLLHRAKLVPIWHHRLIDVESLTAGHHNQRIGGLAACAESLGIPFPDDEQHTALGDARMAMRIWDAIITEEGA